MDKEKNDVSEGAIKDEIRNAYKNVKESIPGFKERSSQKSMIAEVSNTLLGVYGDERVVVAEAPTGTGKSIAYLLSSIPIAKAQKMKVVVSTGTVALQEQLVNRDIPSLIKSSGMEFTSVLAKGRGRYACNKNLAELTLTDSDATTAIGDTGNMFGDEIGTALWPFPPKEHHIKLVADLHHALSGQKWSGDLDEWSGSMLDNDVKALLPTTTGACLGRECSYYAKCAFLIARETMQSADVVVANHHLVLSDIALGGGVILPDPEDTIYIFDEAHHLPDVALAHGAHQSNVTRSQETLKQNKRLLTQALSALGESPERATQTLSKTAEIESSLVEAIGHAENYFRNNFPANTGNQKTWFQGRPSDDQVWRFEHGLAPDGLKEIANAIVSPARDLAAVLFKQREAIKEKIKMKELAQEVASKVSSNLYFQHERITSMANAWAMMGEAPIVGGPPIARWITKKGKSKAGGIEYIVSCSPTSAADALKEGIWDKAAGAVLTSATLTALNKFDHFAERAGLSLDDGTRYVALPSPFDYAANAELHVPSMKSDPTKGNDHTEEVVQILNRDINLNTGVLVLFSARRQMLEVADKVGASIKEQLLVQDGLTKQQILDRHEARVKSGKGSVIFGLASFSEGVDLPGKLCEQVFIAKIPFAVPDSPIDKTYSEWLESVGRNPFMEISVPDATTKLIQACGRLIRTETDQGAVYLLDNRVVSKFYGKMMLNSLPPFKRVIGK